jgi:four helix bundle protein
MQDFRKLEVWQLSHKLTVEIYRCTRQLPQDERFGLTSQIRRAAVSIEANIAEGCGRRGKMDFARFLQQARDQQANSSAIFLYARIWKCYMTWNTVISTVGPCR